ncbi:MAG: hypothetical protein RJA70_3524 [Pseudomonadota bacterium]|jgi:hypothetical protein
MGHVTAPSAPDKPSPSGFRFEPNTPSCSYPPDPSGLWNAQLCFRRVPDYVRGRGSRGALDW